MNGAMPQRSWIGPLAFIVYISDIYMDISPDLLSHKYMDDTTLFECLQQEDDSQLQPGVDGVVRWSDFTRIKVNEKKSKEMVITIKKAPSPLPQSTSMGESSRLCTTSTS